MINASFSTSCCKVSLDKVVDYVKFWHAIFMIMDSTPASHDMDCATGRTERTVRVTANNTVDVTQIYGRWKCRSARN